MQSHGSRCHKLKERDGSGGGSGFRSCAFPRKAQRRAGREGATIPVAPAASCRFLPDSRAQCSCRQPADKTLFFLFNCFLHNRIRLQVITGRNVSAEDDEDLLVGFLFWKPILGRRKKKRAKIRRLICWWAQCAAELRLPCTPHRNTGRLGPKAHSHRFFVPIVSATGTCEKLAVSNFLGRPSREGYSFQLLVDYQSTLLRYHTTRLESSIVSPYYLRFSFISTKQQQQMHSARWRHFKWHELKTFFFLFFHFISVF